MKDKRIMWPLKWSKMLFFSAIKVPYFIARIAHFSASTSSLRLLLTEIPDTEVHLIEEVCSLKVQLTIFSSFNFSLPYMEVFIN